MTNIINEEWRDIPGYEGLYKVSNKGNVISCKRDIPTGSGEERRMITLKEKRLKPCLTRGRYKVNLRKNNKSLLAQVSRIVMWAFVGPQEKGIETRHLNGNPSDDRLENLAYGTKSDNMQDAIKHGTFPLGSRRPGAKINIAKAREIAAHKGVMSDIAREYSLSPSSILEIKRGKNWGRYTKGCIYYKPKESVSFSKEDFKKLLDKNIPRKKLCEEFNISLSQLKRMRKLKKNVIKR